MKPLSVSKALAPHHFSKQKELFRWYLLMEGTLESQGPSDLTSERNMTFQKVKGLPDIRKGSPCGYRAGHRALQKQAHQGSL